MTEKRELPSPEMIRGISVIATHPEFINMVKEIDSKPPAERARYARALATPQELAKRGIPLPEGLRVTTRYFESPEATTVQSEKIDVLIPEGLNENQMMARPTLCVSVGYFLCVSAGG